MRKIIIKILFLTFLLGIITTGCKKDFTEINTDPNRPSKVPTTNLISTATKSLLDDMNDEWWGGRQSLVWSQYWAQRNYTEEDRFQIRQNINNTYFQLIYTDMMDLVKIISLNEDPATKLEYAKYGKNELQIAAAKTLKAWAMEIMVETYGDIPYSEAFNALTNPTPKYDSQVSIFTALLKDLKESADVLKAEEDGDASPAFTSGDILFGGDVTLWKKFANSLRLRIALRLSKVSDASLKALKDAAITEAIAGGVMESNDDNAKLTYLTDGKSNAPMYDAFYTSARNDFTVSAQFVDLLKGINDTLNSKVNPFKGIEDPRIALWVPKNNKAKDYRGMPYGIPSANAGSLKSFVANISTAHNIVLSQDFSVTIMDYSEVCFIMSELNGWDDAWYKKGIQASMDKWGADATAFIAAIPVANEERVLTQKYISLYMQGYDAWAEYRRTGYPKTLVHPGEFSGVTSKNVPITFDALVGSDIPLRLTYPVQEYTINKTSVDAAATSVGGDKLETKLIWE